MKLDTTWIDAYIQQKQIPDQDAWFYQYTNGSAPIALHRQAVCEALKVEIMRYAQFPLWNEALVTKCLPKRKDMVSELVLLPILGSNQAFDAEIIVWQNDVYLLVDVINIADYTQSMKEMIYILHNLCHRLIERYVLLTMDPSPQSYLDQLASRFYVEGISQYLAWNEDVSQYVFHTDRYEKKRASSYDLLLRALQVSDPCLQDSLIQKMDHLDLWNRLPDVAGMLFCDEYNRRYGMPALSALIQKGRNGFIHEFLSNQKY